VRTLNEIALAIIRERRREDRDVGDLLSMLMQARDEETGATMSDDQLRSEVLTFFIAGHETTATALTWTAFLLASHPEQQQIVRDEVLAVLGERPPTVADVMRLERTRMVIDESLRMYPPVWGVVRQPVHDDELAGFHIPARCSVVLCSYITQRHPDFWEQPDVFDPERFTPERAAARHKGAYFPFLSGPHQCIGNEFALLEMRIIIAMIVREFELTLVPGPSIRPVASLTLRPSAPVRIQIRRVAQLLKARLPSA
jgi:cytochrome P450